MRDRPNDQHRRVLESKLGRKLGPNEIAHHVDEDKTNNTPGNLEPKARSPHSADHASKAGRVHRQLRRALRMVKERKKLY